MIPCLPYPGLPSGTHPPVAAVPAAEVSRVTVAADVAESQNGNWFKVSSATQRVAFYLSVLTNPSLAPPFIDQDANVQVDYNEDDTGAAIAGFIAGLVNSTGGWSAAAVGNQVTITDDATGVRLDGVGNTGLTLAILTQGA